MHVPKVVSCNGQIGCRTRTVLCYSWVAVRTELSALRYRLRPRTVRRTGDPLYKHWPFLLVRGEATGSCYGVLYDSMAPATFDLGCEHSNYYGRCGHRLHRVLRRHWCCTFGAVHQACDIMPDCSLLFNGCAALSGFGRTKQQTATWTTILFLGHASGARMPILPAYRHCLLAFIRCLFSFLLFFSCGCAWGANRHVVSRFARLTGRMALGPRWSLGFALTAMPLADAPDAQV